MADNITEFEIGSVSILPAGEYSSTKHYERLSVVTFKGNAYISTQACKGKAVDDTNYWFKLVEKGDTGNGIVSIDKTKTEGLIDTYTITYTNGNTKDFEITNGNYNDKDIENRVDNFLKEFKANMVNNLRTNIANITLEAGTIITTANIIQLPIPYTVGNNSLEIFWNGTRLICGNNAKTGHYGEVGENGNIGYDIVMLRTAEEGNYQLLEDVILTVVARGGIIDENT